MAVDFLRRHPLLAAGTVLGALATVGVRTESRLDPVEWHPPEPPAMTGPLASNHELAGADTVVSCEAPEDVAFDDEGRLYTGSSDGTIRRTREPVEPTTTDADLEPVAYTGGQPLALAFDGDELYVCAAGVGLVGIDPDGNASIKADRAGDREIAFADDLHILEDDTVYFTDATEHSQYQDELLELRDTGRLLAYDPDSGETTVECEGFGFANGLELGPDGESFLVTETSRYRVSRYWFRGDRAGEVEHVAENLPGFPDNIDAHGDGSFWVAIPTLRDPMIDRLHRHPWVGRQLGKLPESAVGALGIDHYGLVLRMAADGEILESLHDPTGDVYGVTSATPHEGALYLGTLFGERVVRYPLHGA